LGRACPVGDALYRQFPRSDRRPWLAAWRGLRADGEPDEITRSIQVAGVTDDAADMASRHDVDL